MNVSKQLDMNHQPVLEGYYTQPDLWTMNRYEKDAAQRLRARVIASLLDTEIESVLDVGCANGFITRCLHAKKYVVGMDPSSQALKHFSGPAVVARGESIPFADASFEAVVCTEVLEHLSADIFPKVLSELKRVSKKYLLIGVPYQEDLLMRTVCCNHCGTRYHADLHCRSFHGPEDLEILFPEYERLAMTLLEHRVMVRSALYRRIRYRCMGPAGFFELAVCPQCGASMQRSSKERKNSLMTWFFEGLDWRMPKITLPNWMIVLFRRR